MNRIISININGVVFNVDELAYDRLRSYLEALHRHFRNTEGKDEIMADIEARIAEMLQQDLKGSKEVVTADDVERIIAAMGHPEDFAEGGETTSQEKTTGSQSYQGEPQYGPRRLYRDTDDRVLGGVCSGMASYFNTDPIWIRILFLVVFFGFGTGLLIYIILWIIIPPAKTAAEKLEMRGYDVNISNIEKSVRGEMNDVKKKWTDIKDDFKREAHEFASPERRQRARGFIGELFEGIGRVLRTVLPIIGKLIGAFFIFIGIIVLISLMVSLLAVMGVVSANVPSVVTDIIGDVDNIWLGIIGAALTVGIPLLVLIYLGIRLIFNRRIGNRWMGPALFILWIAGIFMLGIEGGNSARKFSTKVWVDETDTLPSPTHDTLYVGLNAFHDGNRTVIRSGRHIREMVVINGDDIDLNRVRFDIQKSPDKLYHLVKEKEARGKDHLDAEQMADNIEYAYTMKDSVLQLDEVFNLKKGTHWRAHELHIILQVPSGKVVVMRRNMRRIIYDIQNIQNVYDDDMVDRKWLMTENGLNCLDCPKDIIREGHHRHERWDEDDDDDDDDNVGIQYQSSQAPGLQKSYSIVLM